MTEATIPSLEHQFDDPVQQREAAAIGMSLFIATKFSSSGDVSGLHRLSLRLSAGLCRGEPTHPDCV